MLIKVELDPQGPIRLYHQIAEGLRWQIATGALPAGSMLPPLRQAARDWGVNINTVRRAYQELAEAGLVEIRRPQGTIVLGAQEAAAPRAEQLAEFMEGVRQQASQRFGATTEDLIEALQQRGTASKRVWVLECSRTLSSALAAQISGRWDVDAEPRLVDDTAGVGDGTIVGTYFHFNEIRRHFVGRAADLRFVTIYPDLTTLRRLRRGSSSSGPMKVILCETDVATAHSIAADLSAALRPEAIVVEARVPERPEQLLGAGSVEAPVLFSPGSWDKLAEQGRTHGSAIELRYEIDRGELERLGAELGWRDAR